MSAVTLSRVHDLSMFINPDSSRYALGGIHFRGHHVEATDGRIAIRVPLGETVVGVDSNGVETIGTAEANGLSERCVDGAILGKAIRDGRLRPTTVEPSTDTTCVITTATKAGETTQRINYTEGRFPRMDEIVAKPEYDPFQVGGGLATLTLEANVLAALAKYAMAQSAPKDCEYASVRFTFPVTRTTETGQIKPVKCPMVHFSVRPPNTITDCAEGMVTQISRDEKEGAK